MLKKCSIIISLLLIFSTQFCYAAEINFEISSNNAIIMEKETGQILYGKNQEQKAFPASITKILTALIALEKGKLDDIITISQKAVESSDATSHIALLPGEILTLKDALYGLLLQSANDCAVAIAEYVSALTSEDFSKLMNEKAISLGALNSNFTNSSGLHDEKHYTTATDMALIVREAMKNLTFMEISGTKLYDIAPTNKQTAKRTLSNQNLMLHSGPNYYEYATTGKNGYTAAAKNTMVTTIKRGSLELICVLLNCQEANLKYKDAKSLFEFTFNNYYKTKIDKASIVAPTAKLMGLFGSIGEIKFAPKEDIVVMLDNTIAVKDLEYKYNIKKSYKENKEYVAEISVNGQGKELFKFELYGKSQRMITFYTVIKMLFFIIFVIILIILGIAGYYLLQANRKKKKRRQDKFKRALKIKRFD